MWEHLETRNSAAHYRTNKPEITIAEASKFTQKVIDLYEREKERQKILANELETRRGVEPRSQGLQPCAWPPGPRVVGGGEGGTRTRTASPPCPASNGVPYQLG